MAKMSPVLLTLFLAGCRAPTLEPIKVIAPTYPPIALAANLTGDVRVTVTIASTGAVTAAETANAHPMLDQASLEAAKQWVFNAGLDGRRADLVFSFKTVPCCRGGPLVTATFAPAAPITVEIRGQRQLIEVRNY